jgi:hypothetical protein
LLLFLFQSSLEGWSWFVSNLWIGGAVLLGSVVWILILALLSQAISALVKWRVVASAALLGIFFVPSVFGEVVNQIFATRWGSVISIAAMMKNVSAGLFGSFAQTVGRRTITDFDGNVISVITISEPPLWVCWGVLFLVCAICLAVLSRRVKAYEVVT